MPDTTLCVVRIDITERRRRDLMAACQRLGLEWPALVARVQAAAQDAAVRRMVELTGREWLETETPDGVRFEVR